MIPKDYIKWYRLGLPFSRAWYDEKNSSVTFDTLEDILIYVWKHCPKGEAGIVTAASGGKVTEWSTRLAVNRGRSKLTLQAYLHPGNQPSRQRRIAHTLFVLPMKSFNIDVNGTKIQVKLDYENRGEFEKMVKSLDDSGWKK